MADGNGTWAPSAGNGLDRAIDAEPVYPASATLGVPAFLVPTSLSEIKELARMIALAEWAPDCYRDHDGNYLQQKIEVAILHGATVGLGPIAAVHAIEHSGLLEDMAENYEVDDEDGLTAVCTMKRRDRPTPVVTRFSMAMAERAGLTRTEGPWQSYPERMLRMRARSWTMRDAFADVLRGLQLREEVEDYVGSRGGRPPSVPRRDSRPLGDLRHHSSPRPRLHVGSHGAGPPDEKPAVVSGPPGGYGDGPTAAEPVPAAKTFTLIDADGIVIEIVGPEALRAGFERILFDKHLSAAQLAGVWESNEQARHIIERLLGPEALAEAEEHLKSSAGMSIAPGAKSHEPAVPADNAPANGDAPGQARFPEPDRALALEIDPTWGIQKIFQHYRAALAALTGTLAGDQRTIARFRQVNIAVEERLRAKLSSRIREIDVIYQRVELGSDDAAGVAIPGSSQKGRGPTLSGRFNTQYGGKLAQQRVS